MSAPYTKTSPSQKSNYELCPRRWYFSSIEKRPQPQSPEAAEGEVLHKQREIYQEFGKMPAHPSVLLTLGWTPPPKTPGIIIEAKTTNPPLVIAGLTINGRVDFVDGRDPALPRILDWKTKGNLKGIRLDSKVPKTLQRNIDRIKAELSVDTQLGIYGAWAFVKYPDATHVVLGHGYMTRDVENPAAVLVETDPLPKAHIDGLVAEMVPTLEAMKMDSQATRAEDVRADTTACWAFGARCPFYDFCPRPEQSFGDMFSDPLPGAEDVTLIETLKASPGASEIPDPAKFVGVTSSTPVPVAEATEPVVAVEAPATDLLSRLRAMAGE